MNDHEPDEALKYNEYGLSMVKNVNELTQFLNLTNKDMTSNDHEALNLIYDQLKRIAKAQKYKVSQGELNTTALVNEAWLKLYKRHKIFNDRNHFYATSALAMRHILLNQAQKQIKHNHSSLSEDDVMADQSEAIWLIDLEKHLEKLGHYSKRLEEVFIYRYFGGMQIEEIAALLSLSKRTVNRDWKKAKLMLSVAMG